MAKKPPVEEPLPRETGSQKSGTSCPVCGSALPLVTSAYGSTHAGACASCEAGGASSQLEAQKAAAEEPKEPAEPEV